jgi:REP-associated tyrosine transposase
MARPLRIEIAGGWYHVTARGNERRAIFRDNTDRKHWLALLEQWADRFEIRIHAYVLMDNHYHLLLETHAANLTQAMQWLQVSYTVWFNRRHRRAGHLFQGRYHAILVEGEALGWEISRYIHLNPVRVTALGLNKTAQRRVRAGMNGKPDTQQVRERLNGLRQYRWSSYRVYMGLADRPKWLTTHAVLAAGDGAVKTAQRQSYRQYVEEAIREGLPASPWERLEAQILLGGAEFIRQMKRKAMGNTREQPQLKRLRQRPGFARIVAAVEAEKGESWKAFRDRQGDWGRDVALYLGRRRGGMRLRELAEAAGGIDYSCVQVAVFRIGQKLSQNQKLQRVVSKLESQLYDVET